MALEIIGAIIVAFHFTALAFVILWIGLGMPITVADFRTRFRQTFFSHHPKSGKPH